MRLVDLITAVVLMLLGVLVLGDALRLGAGWGTDGPRSGFFPFWLAVLLLLVALGIFVQAFRRSGLGDFVTRDQLRPVLQVVLPMAAFVVFERWFLVPLPKGPLEEFLGL